MTPPSWLGPALIALILILFLAIVAWGMADEPYDPEDDG